MYTDLARRTRLFRVYFRILSPGSAAATATAAAVAAAAAAALPAGDYANVGEEVQIDWYRLDRQQAQQQ
jgi:hypothetical protein